MTGIIAGMIEVACPHCTARLKVKPQHVGRRCACPKCGQKIELTPSSAGDASEPADPLSALAAASQRTAETTTKDKTLQHSRPIARPQPKPQDAEPEDAADALAALGAASPDKPASRATPRPTPKPIKKTTQPSETARRPQPKPAPDAAAAHADALAALAAADEAETESIEDAAPAFESTEEIAPETTPVETSKEPEKRSSTDADTAAESAPAPAKPIAERKPAPPPAPLTPEQLAKQRRRSHLFVAGTLGTIALASVFGVLFFGLWLFGGDDDSRPMLNPYENLFEIEHNPYLHEQANIMGLPAELPIAIVIDGSGAMREHFDLVRHAVARSAMTLGTDGVGQIIVWTDSEPWVYPAEPTAFATIGADQVVQAMGEYFPQGGMNPAAALQRLQAATPKQVTMICSELPDADTAHAWSQTLKQSRTRLFIVHIDGKDYDALAPDWQNAAATTGGKYFTLNSGRLRRWYDAYQATVTPTDP